MRLADLYASLGAELTENDEREIDTFADYMRRVREAERCGVNLVEAQVAIYPDVYEPSKEAS